MKFELSGEVVEMVKKSVWKSGAAKTPVISLPREYVSDKEEVQLIVVKKGDGSFAIVIQ